jgi:hypothetical protein
VRKIIPLIKDNEGEKTLFPKARELLGIPEPSSLLSPRRLTNLLKNTKSHNNINQQQN